MSEPNWRAITTNSASPKLASQAAIGRMISLKNSLDKGENRAVIKSERAKASKNKRAIRNCFRWQISIEKVVRGKIKKYKEKDRNI